MEQQALLHQPMELGIKDKRVFDALSIIDRKIFVPVAYASRAYANEPLPIGNEQTIS